VTLRARNALLIGVAAAFSVAFAAICVPPLVTDYGGNFVEALGDGFVNPMSSGYSLDVISCWLVLSIWVVYERTARGIRGGWIALLLGVVPGVAVGFVAYLLIRERTPQRAAE
jgi:Terpene cyclase DEP1